MTLTVTPVTGALGAVIDGVDIRDPELDFDPIYRAFLEHEVIFFREVNLTAQEHLDFGRRFGTPSIYPIAHIRGATEPTMTVIADGPESPNAADVWHTDVTWIATPPKAALLHMETPALVGGDTLWASATKAFDALSSSMQQFLCELTVRHDTTTFVERFREKTGAAGAAIVEALEREYPPVEHPLVRTHPETGKRSLLYARPAISHIINLTASESAAVLGFLDAHITDVSLHCRWHWSKGDLAIWDERSTLHRAAGDHWPHVRVVRRIEIDGDRPYLSR